MVFLPAIAHGVTSARDEARVERLRSYVRSNQREAAIGLADSLIAEAELAGDRRALGERSRTKGEVLVRFGRGAEAEPLLARAIRIGRELGDTTLVLRSLFRRMYLLPPPAAERVRAEMHALAAARRDTLHLALASVPLAFAKLSAGNFRGARDDYRRIVGMLESIHDRNSIPNALIGLGRAYFGLGDYGASRECAERALRAARETGDAWSEAHAANNLGTLDFVAGDPAAALPRYRRAVELHLSRGDARGALVALLNVAIAHKHVWHFDDAARALDEARDVCRRHHLPEVVPEIDVQEAGMLQMRGRPREAAELAGAVLARGDGPGDGCPPRVLVLAARAVASALAQEHRPAEALAILDRECTPRQDRVGRAIAQGIRLDRVRMLAELGRDREAGALARDVEARAREFGLRELRLDALTLLGDCERTAGRPVEARAAFDSAARVWERERNASADPDWRTQRGLRGRSVFVPLALLELDHGEGTPQERVRRAFDRLQSYKARTTRERVRGPEVLSSDGAPAVRLDALQRDVLGDGDLLLDAYLGPDASLLFAVTRSSVEVLRLPGDEALKARVTALRELLSSPPRRTRDPGREQAVAAASGAFGRLLLDGLEARVSASRRILFVPDGALGLVPLAALRLEGDELGRDRAIVHVPSASLLADLLCGPVARSAGPPRVVVVAGARDGAGRSLPGSERETRWIERQFARVSRPTAAGDSARGRSRIPACEIFHVAAHATVNDLNPSRSGFRLDAADSSAFLTAAEIAAGHAAPRLAFLSGCESAGGRPLAGEGVQGISSAFLMAGSRTVVASLWSVDDRVTVELVQAFYRALASGAAADQALRSARRALERRAATADPFFWASFVVIGDGATRLPLERRGPAPGALLAWGAALLLVLGIAARRLGSAAGRRAPVIPAPSRRPTP